MLMDGGKARTCLLEITVDLFTLVTQPDPQFPFDDDRTIMYPKLMYRIPVKSRYHC